MRPSASSIFVLLTVTILMFSVGTVEALDVSNTVYGTSAGVSLPATSTFPNSVYNTMIGFQAGYSTTTGGYNTFIGQAAGHKNVSGRGNTFVGESAGSTNLGGYNVFIGNLAGSASSYQDSNSRLIIDNCNRGSSLMQCDMPLIYGEFDNRLVQIDGTLVMVTVATPSDKRYKKDIHPLEASLDRIMHLQGVSYEWDKEKVNGAGYKGGKQIGLVAQEVEKVLPELVHTDSKGYKTVSYDKLVPVLIEAVKEQQALISEKDARIEKLERDNERIARALEKLSLQVAAIEGSAKTVALK